MKTSLEWLKEYVDIEVNIEDLVSMLTMTGTKVEGYEVKCGDLENIIVGKIEKIVKHPSSEKLLVCQVNIGSKVIQVVTAATNIFEGAYVPVAIEGSKINGGLVISKVDFKGVFSEGMMLSIDEMGVTKDEFVDAPDYGIYIINKKCNCGDSVINVLNLNDIILDFEITSNRSDCLSTIGIAREIAAIYNKDLRLPDTIINDQKDSIKNFLDSVIIEDPNICKRYIAKVVKNIKICDSPEWLRKRLIAAGVRPINNIVDITNYVMLEIGQPMHAFDYRKISGKRITVRKAKNGEQTISLDGNQRVLSTDDIVIADSEKIIAIAGVMGGANSEISTDTNTIVIESATFNNTFVRKTAQRLALRTEASSRFEKGLSTYLAKLAIDRACNLIQQLGYGEIVEGEIDNYLVKEDQVLVDADFEFINKFLGINIDKQLVIDILNKLEIKYDQNSNTFIIPPFRNDLYTMEDIAEEVIRIYGYDKLNSTIPFTISENFGLTKKQEMVDKIKNYLAVSGYYEIFNYSFESPKVYNILKGYDLAMAVKIINPLGEDYSIMRMQLINSMLKTLYLNYSRNIKDVKLFEISNIFEKSKDVLPNEILKLSVGSIGNTDFYALKGIVENIFDLVNINKNIRFVSKHNNQNYHPTRSAEILIDEYNLGYIGELHPDVLEGYDISQRVYYCELNLDLLYENIEHDKKYSQLPKYPSVQRDYAFIVPEDIENSLIESIFYKHANDIIEDFYLFDIYKGAQIKEGFKSYAYKVTYRSAKKTLNDADIFEIQQKILDDLSNHNIHLRE
ncbi:phenylalanine--tRNA ligase subunit beta [Caldicellulosiruptoraceae bacterium PP1]